MGTTTSVDDLITDAEVALLEPGPALWEVCTERPVPLDRLREALATIWKSGGDAATKAAVLWHNDEFGGFTPLHKACETNRFCSVDVVNAILEHVYEEDLSVTDADFGATPLHVAAGNNGEARVVTALLSKGADARIGNAAGETPLHDAAANKNAAPGLAMLDFVHAWGKLDVNVKSRNGETPLHKAVDRGNEAMVEALLRKGADPNVQNTHGDTALHWAAANGDVAAVDHLLEAGAVLTLANVNGYTPLHDACLRAENEPVVTRLCAAGSVIDQGTNAKDTPLHLACGENNAAIARTLLRYGAPTDRLNSDNETPMDLAKIRKAKSAIKVLNHHAKRPYLGRTGSATVEMFETMQRQGRTPAEAEAEAGGAKVRAGAAEGIPAASEGKDAEVSAAEDKATDAGVGATGATEGKDGGAP